MSAPQIVHVEELAHGARTYTLTAVRVEGGLAGQWHCPCGDAGTLSATSLTIRDALDQAKRDVAVHHNARHSVVRNCDSSKNPP
jgi:hypothetical protein